MARPHSRPQGRLAILIALVALAALAWTGTRGAAPAGAAGEGCAGSGPAPCPYRSASIIGQRAEGVLRFPEAVAVDSQGNVYVADQLSYVVEKFTAAGAFETQWGSYGGGHGQFGPIGGIATDAAGNVYVLDSSHNRIEKFSSNGEFITDWGRKGHELGEFEFGSSQNYTQPPGGGIAVGGNYVYVADSGNNRVERFNLNGGEPLQWGTHGSEPGQFSYPRGIAANEGEVIVADDDNHRLERFSPEGAYAGSVGSQGAGPGQFAYPYGVALDAAGNVYVADDLNDRVVKLNPQLGFAGAWGGFGSKAGQLAFPRALASDPAGDTYVADTANDRIEVFDPEGDYLRSFGLSARGRGPLTAPRGLAIDPTGRLLVSDTVGNRIELFAPASFAYEGQWTSTEGHSPGYREPSGIGVDPRGSIYIADGGDERIVHLWGDGTYLGEIGGPADLGGAQLNGVGSVAVSAATGDTYVADSGHNRVLVYSPSGTLLARWGANEGDGAAGGGPGQFDHPDALAIDGAGNVYVADTANNRVVELSPTGAVVNTWGSRGTTDGRFHSPTGIAVDGFGRVFVLDSENNRVEVFEAGGRFAFKWGLRGIAAGEFSQPQAIAVDCSGAVYVADTNNNRVQRFELDAPANAGCLAAGAWPPPLDVAPVLRVSLQRSSGILARGGIALAVSCQRGCKLRASATLAPLGRPRLAVRLIATTRGLPPALTGHLRLRISGTALRRLQGELGRHRGLRARITLLATGPTGRQTAVTRLYTLAR